LAWANARVATANKQINNMETLAFIRFSLF
jgi:hypothetical protein